MDKNNELDIYISPEQCQKLAQFRYLTNDSGIFIFPLESLYDTYLKQNIFPIIKVDLQVFGNWKLHPPQRHSIFLDSSGINFLVHITWQIKNVESDTDFKWPGIRITGKTRII